MKQWYSPAELVGCPGIPSTISGVHYRAKKDGWRNQKRQGRGGGREYHIRSLPEITRAHLAARAINEQRNDPDAKAGAMAGRRLAVTAAIDAAVEKRAREHGLARAAGLQGGKRRRMEARLTVLTMLDDYVRQSHLPPSIALHMFCTAYNRGEITPDDGARDCIAQIHPATVYRWRQTLRGHGAAGLAGAYGSRSGTSKIDTQPELQRFVIAMLVDHPHCSCAHIQKGMRARFADGAVELPSKRSLERWVTNWKRENKQTHLAIANPDAWKNRHMTAFGSASADIRRINQLWEFDSTPADVMLLDGRHSIIGVVDIYPRRAKLLVSKTSKATAIATLIRRALLAWGVPEAVKTDNGQDYTSHHIRRVFGALNVEHRTCQPFAGWEKPHIERFFGTFTRDLVELLPNYIGHNVAERAAINARQSFADRLMRRGEAVEIAMTAAEFQRFCDEWLDSVYHHQAHASLDQQTPFEVTAACRSHIHAIDDERALDVLLAEAPGDGMRTVTKKGIAVDRFTYIAAELGEYVGERVHVRFDPDDVGRVYVFGGPASEFICIADDPAYTGISRRDVAIHARERQKSRIQHARAELKRAARKEKTKDIAAEILSRRAADTGNLLSFPQPSSLYDSDGLRAAQDVITALDRPADDLPPVDEAAILRVQAMMRDEQQQDETAEDRFRRWIKLDQALMRGEQLCETDARWKAQFETTSEFRGRKMIYDDFGPGAFGAVEQ